MFYHISDDILMRGFEIIGVVTDMKVRPAGMAAFEIFRSGGRRPILIAIPLDHITVKVD